MGQGDMLEVPELEQVGGIWGKFGGRLSKRV